MQGSSKVILGIAGGIAAIKCVDLVKYLKELDLEIPTIMTKSAENFVDAKSLIEAGAMSVTTSLFDNASDMPHIDIAKNAAVMVIAPATANTVAKLAAGIADDALTTTALVLKCPLLIAPSMNDSMWDNIATKSNMRTLETRGIEVIGPETGKLACGDIGIGRMSEPLDIVERIKKIISRRNQLGDVYFIVTAGGTREPLDDIRYLGNRSSGKMGFWLAKKLRERGAKVTLIAGPNNLIPPSDCEYIQIETVEEMRDEVVKRFDRADAVVMTAAVGDYRFKKPTKGKIKKSERPLSLEMVPATDILKELGDRESSKMLIGFAAENGGDLEGKARGKLEEKNLDMIIANRIDDSRIGFESDFNEVTILTSKSIEKVPFSSKATIAESIVDRIVSLRKKRASPNN